MLHNSNRSALVMILYCHLIQIKRFDTYSLSSIVQWHLLQLWCALASSGCVAAGEGGSDRPNVPEGNVGEHQEEG